MSDQKSVSKSISITHDTVSNFADDNLVAGTSENIVFVSKSINELLEIAHLLFMTLPVETRDKITGLHHYEGSIIHCLNAGIAATAEIDAAAETIAKPHWE